MRTVRIGGIRAVARMAVWLVLGAAVASAQVPAVPAAPADGAPTTPGLSATTAAPAASGLLRVFLDCERFCDNENVRQTVGFVDHVLDRAAADVHVLVTSQTSGGGGLAWEVQFIGVGRYRGPVPHDPVRHAGNGHRRRTSERVSAGVSSGCGDASAATTAASPQLNVTWTAPRTDAARAAATVDPWNYWVFNTRVNGNMNGEASQRSVSHNLSLSANRTTDQLKVLRRRQPQHAEVHVRVRRPAGCQEPPA